MTLKTELSNYIHKKATEIGKPISFVMLQLKKKAETYPYTVYRHNHEITKQGVSVLEMFAREQHPEWYKANGRLRADAAKRGRFD